MRVSFALVALTWFGACTALTCPYTLEEPPAQDQVPLTDASGIGACSVTVPDEDLLMSFTGQDFICPAGCTCHTQSFGTSCTKDYTGTSYNFTADCTLAEGTLSSKCDLRITQTQTGNVENFDCFVAVTDAGGTTVCSGQLYSCSADGVPC
jgi:hypothetical protein